MWREEIISPNILDIVLSVEDSHYPPPGMDHFGERSTTVFVYLGVEDLPMGHGTEARVERVGRT